MAVIFPYRDPVVSLESFLTKVRKAWTRTCETPRGVTTGWTDDGFQIMSQYGVGITLSLLLSHEYLYACTIIDEFNRDVPER